MSKYIVISNMKINNANAQPAWWLVSAPALTAYVGFAHALALRLGASGHEGAAIVHHDIQFLGEEISGCWEFKPYQLRAAALVDKKDYVEDGARGPILSLQPSARCHLNISLVIAVPEETELSLVRVKCFLRGARLAGGSLIKYDAVEIKNSTDEALKAIKKNGFSIVERQDLMEKKVEDRDYIDVLLRNTCLYESTSAEKDEKKLDADEAGIKTEDQQKSSWIVPTCLGYAGISKLKVRKKARHGLPHLYVEPLIGLVQYQNVKVAKLHFWRYHMPQPNVFIISTQLNLGTTNEE